MTQSRLLNLKEACELLQCSPAFLYKISRSGELKSLKVGRYWRFSAEDISAWVTAKKENRLSGEDCA